MVQALVGLGLGLVAAPVLTLVEPSLMPGTMLLLAALMPALTIPRDAREVDWRGLGWALPARVLGTAFGVVIVGAVSVRTLGVGVAVMVLVSVVLSLHTVRVRVTHPRLLAVGVVSGITGTATSIGGPPMALLYQSQRPGTVRATLGVYFVVGAALSILGLSITGSMTRAELVTAVALVPFLGLGYLASLPLRSRLHGSRTRGAVLLVCAASALTLLVRSLTV